MGTQSDINAEQRLAESKAAQLARELKAKNDAAGKK